MSIGEPHFFTDVLPPDLTMHPTFPAQPGFVPMAADQDVYFRHSGWLRDRRRVFEALGTAFPRSTRLTRFAECGSRAWVIRNEDQPDLYAVASDHCHDRFCKPCASFRGRVIANNVAAYLRNRPYRFLTLTIRTTDLTLKQGVDKLYRCFAALRRTKIWDSKVSGGCAILEVKPKESGTGWHPHIHAILEGRYLPLPLIRRHWMRITTDSFIVDIAKGRDPEQAARYVSKYITKPFDDGTIRNPERLLQAVEALHGRRLVATFGRWRGQRLTVYTPTSTWIRIAPLGMLRAKAKAGDDDALTLYTYLSDNKTYRNVPKPRIRGSPAGENDERSSMATLFDRPGQTSSDDLRGGHSRKPDPSLVTGCPAGSQLQNDNSVAGGASLRSGFRPPSLPTTLPSGRGLRPRTATQQVAYPLPPPTKWAGCPAPPLSIHRPATERLRADTPPAKATAENGGPRSSHQTPGTARARLAQTAQA